MCTCCDICRSLLLAAFANPITLATLQSQMSADAHQLLAFVQWVAARNAAYQQSGITPAQLTAWGVSAADNNAAFAFAADLNRINAYFNGNPQTVASILVNDINNINGVS